MTRKKIVRVLRRLKLAFSYEAYLSNSDKVEGQETSFLEQLIQHEINHTEGVLFIDKAGSTFDLEEYRNTCQVQLEELETK